MRHHSIGAPARERKRLVWRSLDLFHDGKRFLARRGLDFRLFGIYVHQLDADPGMDLHDHPWPFVSIILRGSYWEAFSDTRWAGDSLFGQRKWKRWSIHRMPLTVAHRIMLTEPGTVSLILRGRKVRRWGFYQPDGWVDWERYDYDERRPVWAVRHDGDIDGVPPADRGSATPDAS